MNCKINNLSPLEPFKKNSLSYNNNEYSVISVNSCLHDLSVFKESNYDELVLRENTNEIIVRNLLFPEVKGRVKFEIPKVSSFQINEKQTLGSLSSGWIVSSSISPQNEDSIFSLKFPNKIVSIQKPTLLGDRSELTRSIAEPEYSCCCPFCGKPSKEEYYKNEEFYSNNIPYLRSGPQQSILNAPQSFAGDQGIRFEEVKISASESIIREGRSWGGAWGDVNGDGYTDLWINYHQLRPSLYLNQASEDGTRTFVEATNQIFGGPPINEDHHGTAWADFDNDGDQDLAQMVGAGFGLGSKPKFLYVNNDVKNGGILEDKASELGVDYPILRGRGVLWYDFNNDGLLDYLAGGYPREDDQIARPKIFLQESNAEGTSAGTFKDGTSLTGFETDSAVEFSLSDLNRDGRLDLITNTYSGSVNVYDLYSGVNDTSALPLRNITAEVFQGTRALFPSAVADFNGDLLPDIYNTRGGGGLTGGKDVVQIDANSAAAQVSLKYPSSSQRGFQFDSTGNVTFEIRGFASDQIFIGSEGSNPSGEKFALSPQNAVGIKPHTPGTERDRGVYIGYDNGRWQVLYSGPNGSSGNLFAGIESTQPITELRPIGFGIPSVPAEDTLLINSATGFIDQSDAAGINSLPTYGKSAVAGDFDNDMDMDLYISTGRSALNTPNVLLENQGNGKFIAAPDAWGATGTEAGIADFVISADYDLDGFLDLLVANGEAEVAPRELDPNSLLPVFQGSPYQLFRNTGNGNHWLQIDLQGDVSNRGGIGARALLTTGGITQLREQSNGVHGQSQNFQRLHFGMADNPVVQELVIKWPSGREQRITNLPGDQLVRVIEAGGPDNNRITGTGANDIAAGEEGNDTLQGQEGNDILDGGSDNDTAVFGNADNNVNLSQTEAQLTGEGIDTLSNIENLVGGEGNDTLTGSTGNNLLDGGNGNDSLTGGDGDDTLAGGSAIDTAVFGNADNNVNLNQATGQVTGEGTDTLSSIENLVGGEGNDTLTGSTGNNLLDGGNGNDSLTGGSGNDTVSGGMSDDALLGSSGNDSLDGGLGNDTLLGGTGNDVLSGGSGTDTVTYGTANNTVNFNTMTAQATGEGTDTLSGIEDLIGGGGNDILTGDANDNRIDGGVGSDIVNGSLGSDTLIGGTGNDSLLGGDGNDRQIGGSGKDALIGGTGIDTFAYSTLADSSLANYDFITDYLSDDRIDAPGSVAVVNLTGYEGNANSLNAADVSAVLNRDMFIKNSAKAFTVTGMNGTFIALNNATDGFQSTSDSIIYLEGFTIGTANPVFIL